ncbi:MAG TPA: M48 family peptidase, partial [Burkholderiaceae bacterium]
MPTSFLPPLSAPALSLAFAVALLASMALKYWLATRQIRHVVTHRESVPAAFSAQVPLDAHRKAADYTVARARFGLLSIAFNAAVLLGWTLLGGLDALNNLVQN